MPRFHKEDERVTKVLKDNGLLLHEDSHFGWDGERVPHLYLAGADMENQRLKVFGRAKGRCQKCGRACSWHLGEVHHVLPRGKGGSEDLDNLEWRCGRFMGDCHTGEHVQVQWSTK